ncbi:unnamed protein product [Orchesella dallaii]|uniref:PiggyBac transposable element-derived protein domain-containing protein n=1 Tax=Orchesella dallaii TaxID=48710 RepID=A0ABP1RY67_9HEXA
MSPKLAHHLLDHNTYVLGTVRKSRKNMPKITKEDGKLGKGCVQTYNDGKILVERWMDRREVFMLNTFISHEMTPTIAANPKNTREKPQSVLVYNAKMGAVDDVDKQIRPYEAMRKSIKWYKKYAFYLLDLCVYNTYRVYLLLDQNRARPRYKQFLLDLINAIIVAEGVSLPQRPQQIPSVAKSHLPICTRGPTGRKSYSNCWYCYNKLNGKRTQTSFKCLGCNRRFCIRNENSCFMLAHQNVSYKLFYTLKTKTSNIQFHFNYFINRILMRN